MKNNILIIVSILTFLFTSSCSEVTDFDLVEDPNTIRLDNLNPDLMLNNLQLSFIDVINSFSDATNEIMRYELMDDNYSIYSSDAILNSNWRSIYRNRNFRITLEDFVANDNRLIVHRGIAKILNAYEFATLVDYLGDIPYNNIDPLTTFHPKREDGIEVYKNLIAEIDLAIQDFEAYKSNPEDVQLPTNDFYYNIAENKIDGADNWIKLANSLKLKMFVNMGDEAQNDINTLMANDNFINNESDDFQFQYYNIQSPGDSRHPNFLKWDGINNNTILYMGNYFINLLRNSKSIPDPRIRYYLYRQANDEITNLPCETSPIATICNVGDGYLGRDHGDDSGINGADELRRTIYGRYPSGGTFDGKNIGGTVDEEPGLEGRGITPVLLSSYVGFLKAEAVLRLNATGEDPGDLLSTAIGQSMDKTITFGGSVQSASATTQTDIDTYIDEVINEFDNANNAIKLDIIIREFYLATFGNSIESYNAYRRTGLPSDIQLSVRGINAPFPRTFSLPSTAVDANINISQRSITNKVFWDTNPANFIN